MPHTTDADTDADNDADAETDADLYAGVPVVAAEEPAGGLAKWWDDEGSTNLVRAALGGNSTVAAAYRQLVADGVVDCTYQRFTVQLKKHLTPAVHGALTAHGKKKGREQYLNQSLYCTDVVPHRNKRWQADVQEVPVRVRGAQGRRFDKVWMINFIDEAHRVVTGFSLTIASPTAEDVKAALVAAVAGGYTADGLFYGGLPEAIKWDNGKEFLNEAVSHACISLGIVPMPVAPHSGFAKGKIERFHDTSQRMHFSNLRGAINGPKTYTGQRPWRGPDEDLMPFEVLVDKTIEWVEAYNTRHVHSSLGCTPMQSWAADPVAIEIAPIESLHPLMLTLPKSRKVNKDGISYANVKFVSPALADHRGRKVEVRALPHNTDCIWVFDPKTGEYLCDAIPAERLTPAQRREIVRRRAEDWRISRRAILDGADRRARDHDIEAVLAAEEAARTARTNTPPQAEHADGAAAASPNTTDTDTDTDPETRTEANDGNEAGALSGF